MEQKRKLVEIGRKITGMIAAANHVARPVFIALPEPSHKPDVCWRQQVEMEGEGRGVAFTNNTRINPLLKIQTQLPFFLFF